MLGCKGVGRKFLGRGGNEKRPKNSKKTLQNSKKKTEKYHAFPYKSQTAHKLEEEDNDHRVDNVSNAAQPLRKQFIHPWQHLVQW